MIRNIHLYLLLLWTFCFLGTSCEKTTDQNKNLPGAVDPLQNHNDLSVKKNDIKDFWISFRKATRYRTRENWDSAIIEYKKALIIDPEHEDALFYLGNMYLETGQFVKAEQCWKSLSEINPESAKAYFQLGNLYMNFDRENFFNLDSAEKYIRMTSKLNRLTTGPLLALARIRLVKQDLEKADELLKAVIGSNDKNTEAYFLRGYIYWLKGMNEEALIQFRNAIETSEPEAPVEGVLSEGDTKSGSSLARPANQSIFYSFLQDLERTKIQDPGTVLHAKYVNLDLFINELDQK